MKRLLLSALPILAIVGLNVWAQVNRERFPDPLATHWGLSGEPDGFASLNTHLIFINLGLGLVAAIWILVSYISTVAALRVMFLAIIGYLFMVLFALMTQTLVIQLDISDPASTHFGAGLLLWLLPLLALIPLLLAKPEVRVTQSVEVWLRGIRFLKLPLSEISGQRATEVRAADFGGWGLRHARKTTAFVPSSGAALELELARGGKILIRSDNPAQLVAEIDNRRRAG